MVQGNPISDLHTTANELNLKGVSERVPHLTHDKIIQDVERDWEIVGEAHLGNSQNPDLDTTMSLIYH